MALETRKEKMDHMFALMEEVRVLVGRLDEHPEIPSAVRLLTTALTNLRRSFPSISMSLKRKRELTACST